MRAFFAILILTWGLFGDAATPLDAVSGLRLRDQYGVEDSLDAHRGRTVVVIVVDAKRLRTVKAWERELRERFDSLDYLRVAVVPADPPTTWERVADKLREQVPEGVPVLIDLDRRWATELELDTSRPNLLVVDAGGRLAASFAGRHDPALAAVVTDNLAALVTAP